LKSGFTSPGWIVVVTHTAHLGPGVIEPELGAGCRVAGRYSARDVPAQVEAAGLYHRGVLVGRGAETAMIEECPGV
jgi:hypothetical protein